MTRRRAGADTASHAMRAALRNGDLVRFALSHVTQPPGCRGDVDRGTGVRVLPGRLVRYSRDIDGPAHRPRARRPVCRRHRPSPPVPRSPRCICHPSHHVRGGGRGRGRVGTCSRRRRPVRHRGRRGHLCPAGVRGAASGDLSDVPRALCRQGLDGLRRRAERAGSRAGRHTPPRRRGPCARARRQCRPRADQLHHRAVARARLAAARRHSGAHATDS